MRRSKESDINALNLRNCFGFNENDFDISFLNNSTVLNDTAAPIEFQPNKPFRLALYVKPAEQRRIFKTNASILMRSILDKQVKNKKTEKCASICITDKSEIKKVRKKDIKNKNVMLFDENAKPDKIKKTPEKPKLLDKNVSFAEVSSTKKNVLKEVNMKPVTKTKQNKVRRSYERKAKEKEVEKIVEPPSEEIIKEIEIKKLSRTKRKKTNKDEEEFENWASDMNSAFDDVEKFELSITYD